MSVVFCAVATRPKCIGTGSQLITVLSRLQSALRSANELANFTVERIHLNQW